MKSPCSLIFLAIILTSLSFTAHSQGAEPVTLITNVNVFDGVNEKLLKGANVLIEGNLIKQVSTEQPAANGATLIDGGGRTLIPGLIDAHWHTTYCCAPQSVVICR